MSNPAGRPAYTPSRRRYAEAIRSLKSILKRDKQPAVIHLRACELLFLAYGMTLPGGLDKRDKRAITELVTESNMERALNRQIDIGDAPTHGSVFVYLGKRKDVFVKHFSQFGPIFEDIRLVV
jgi:hypothetical protein